MPKVSLKHKDRRDEMRFCLPRCRFSNRKGMRRHSALGRTLLCKRNQNSVDGVREIFLDNQLQLAYNAEKCLYV